MRNRHIILPNKTPKTENKNSRNGRATKCNCPSLFETPISSGNGKRLPRLLADENISPGIIETFRNAGFDVLSATEAGLRRVPDEKVFAFAAMTGRVILTLDKKFAKSRLFSLPDSAGVVLLPIKANKRALEGQKLREAIRDHFMMLLKEIPSWAEIALRYRSNETAGAFAKRFDAPDRPEAHCTSASPLAPYGLP